MIEGLPYVRREGDDRDAPHYVVEVKPEVWLDGGRIGDEGFARWGGLLAGPFGREEDAWAAYTECGPSEGYRCAVWTPVLARLSIPAEEASL